MAWILSTVLICLAGWIVLRPGDCDELIDQEDRDLAEALGITLEWRHNGKTQEAKKSGHPG